MIGIDLGTTSSCVAFLEERRTPKVIEASRSTPSVVAINRDDKLIGTAAKEQVHNIFLDMEVEPVYPHTYKRLISYHHGYIYIAKL